MAIQPRIIHIPVEISATDSEEFILESQIEDQPVHDPVVFFWNTSAESVSVQVEYILDFGVTGNPLETGTHIFDLVSTTVVTTGERLVIPIKSYSEALQQLDSAAPITEWEVPRSHYLMM